MPLPRWRGQSGTPTGSPKLREIDIDTDNTLSAMRDAIEAQLRVLKTGDPLGAAGAKLQRQLFPAANVAAITTLPYVEEIAQVDRILETLRDKAWKKTIAELGISRHIARLTELAEAYHGELDAPAVSAVTFAMVTAAREKGQRLVVQAAAMIFGRHPSDSPEDLAGCAALLAPILEQNEAIREYLRTRRAVPDVNPETGEEDPNASGTGGKPM